jgi:hypothetical protein
MLIVIEIKRRDPSFSKVEQKEIWLNKQKDAATPKQQHPALVIVSQKGRRLILAKVSIRQSNAVTDWISQKEWIYSITAKQNNPTVIAAQELKSVQGNWGVVLVGIPAGQNIGFIA